LNVEGMKISIAEQSFPSRSMVPWCERSVCIPFSLRIFDSYNGEPSHYKREDISYFFKICLFSKSERESQMKILSFLVSESTLHCLCPIFSHDKRIMTNDLQH
jgi:hypothetical protein